MGNAFEILCLNHLPQIAKGLGISGISFSAYAWKSKRSKPGAQIDLLIDRRDDMINICEMKYTDDEYIIDAEYEKQLLRKSAVFRNETSTRKTVQLILVSAEGLKRNAHSDCIMHVITGKELFETVSYT